MYSINLSPPGKYIDMKSIFKSILYLLFWSVLVQCTKSECTGIYAPVCGADGKSYRNICLARAAGNTSSSEGICTNITPATVRYYGDQADSKCTWLLEIEEDSTNIITRWFTPELPESLKVENQKVEVNFLPNDIAFNCIIDGEEQLIIYMDLIGIEAN